jgi:flagellar FliJ protein
MFIFKMQSVLEYRINMEEKVHNEFSEKKRELDTQRLRMKSLIEERINLIAELRTMQDKPLPADDFAAYISYVEQVRENEKKQKIVIHQAKEQVESKRKELIEAVKQRKIMEKLKQQHAEEYNHNLRDLEQKASDEMSVLKFGRRGT